jgi:hypothetical protein
VGGGGAALLEGGEGQAGVEGQGAVLPGEADERGLGQHGEAAEAVGAGGRERGSVEHGAPPGGCMGMPGACRLALAR